MSGLETALLIGSLATSVAGTAVSAVGAQRAGEAQAQAAEAEARAMERKANEERAASQRQAIRQSREAERVLSRQQAVAAASGGSATDKTVLDIMGDTAAEGQYQTAAALYEGESSGRGLESQAEISRFKGREAKRAGRINAFSTTLSGLGSFASGASKLKF